MPISKPHSSFGGNNKGSSSALVSYLEKENRDLNRLADKAKTREEAIEYRDRQQAFFSHKKDKVSRINVIDKIDNNKKKLTKKDDKFYAPTISFSKKELEHIAYKVSGKKNIKDIDELSKREFKAYNAELRNYTRKVMDNYAQNFNRQNKGLKTGNDLVYFAKVEHKRKYRGTDTEVVKGKARAGQNKKGLQSHVHVIVSRKDKEQRLKLNPTTNEKNTVRKIGNNQYRVGFDRKEWINQNEKTFDKYFGYKRSLNEKFEIQNKLINGKVSERVQLKELISKERIRKNTKAVIKHKGLGI